MERIDQESENKLDLELENWPESDSENRPDHELVGLVTSNRATMTWRRWGILEPGTGRLYN